MPDAKQKTLEDYFQDWEGEALGFGYGTGEEHTIHALQTFLSLCTESDNGGYNYQVIETALGSSVTWFLINLLCREDIIQYGSSPRYAWLSVEGRRLKDFVCSKTLDELYAITTRIDEDDVHCYKKACNCGKHGDQAGVLCKNPFWKDRVK